MTPINGRRGVLPYFANMMRIQKALLTAAVALIAAFFAITESLADFRVCNRTDQRVDVAFGYPHPQFGWTSEGWWGIAPWNCHTIYRGTLTNRFYYVFATGAAGAVWQGPQDQNGGFFCVQPEKFVFTNNSFVHDGALNCEHHSLQGKRFILVDTGGAPNHVHNLSIE